MIKKIVSCDICKKDCSSDPWGVSFGTLNDPQKAINLQLCKPHYESLLNIVYNSLAQSNGETS